MTLCKIMVLKFYQMVFGKIAHHYSVKYIVRLDYNCK